MSSRKPTRQSQTVTPAGESCAPVIDGVKEFRPVTHEDERGSLCEIYAQAWNFDDIPLVHAYLVTVRPGMVKGWAVHEKQVDRYFFVSGASKLVLYDDRRESPTHGLVTEKTYSDINRALVSVPPGVFHAVECLGERESVLFVIPSEPYHYELPADRTTPEEKDLIPYPVGPKRGF